jgi:small subunit ribosomal protein S6
MTARTALYETIFVLHPELSEEEAEEAVQSLHKILEDRGSETIRIERGGKRRLAYPIRKQRYGYYTLIHFRALPDALLELERIYRLNDRVLRYISVRYDKEEQMTGFTRQSDDDGRDDGRDDRRRMGRRTDSYRGAPEDRRTSREDKPDPGAEAKTDEEPETTPEVTAKGDEEPEASPEVAEADVSDDEESEETTG